VSEPEGESTHVTRGCFACGTENTAGLGLRPRKLAGAIVAEFTPRPHHRGLAGIVHGGIVACALDEVITCAASVAMGALAATTALEVAFRAPLRIGKSYQVCARYLGREGALHVAEGEIVDERGQTVATGRGSFAELTPEKLSRLNAGTPQD
jgi:uncharacterized protein (TIGR00369 family)